MIDVSVKAQTPLLWQFNLTPADREINCTKLLTQDLTRGDCTNWSSSQNHGWMSFHTICAGVDWKDPILQYLTRKWLPSVVSWASWGSDGVMWMVKAPSMVGCILFSTSSMSAKLSLAIALWEMWHQFDLKFGHIHWVVESRCDWRQINFAAH